MKIVQSTFTKYQLTNQEFLQGQILSTDQKAVIQNEIADIADNIINLTYVPADPLLFVQQEAFLKGQLTIYRLMLDKSESAEKQLVNPQTAN